MIGQYPITSHYYKFGYVGIKNRKPAHLLTAPFIAEPSWPMKWTKQHWLLLGNDWAFLSAIVSVTSCRRCLITVKLAINPFLSENLSKISPFSIDFWQGWLDAVSLADRLWQGAEIGKEVGQKQGYSAHCINIRFLLKCFAAGGKSASVGFAISALFKGKCEDSESHRKSERPRS